MNGEAKKILFVLRSAEYLHYFFSLVQSLLDRGYEMRILAEKKWTADSSLAAFEALKKQYPMLSYGWAESRLGFWQKVLFHTRELLSFRRYLIVKEHAQSRYYRDRYLGYLPRRIQAALTYGWVRRFLASRLCRWALKMAERIAPAAPGIIRDLRSFSPVAVIASPVDLRFPGSDLEYLKAAKRLAIPTALPVLSWDNLTTKGLIHVMPDRLLVWNDVQVDEAGGHQNIPNRIVRIVGSPVFDIWFSKLSPSFTREEFCGRYNLRASDPIVVYLGSSSHMAEDETWLVEEIRKVFDTSVDERIRRTQIIIRPHPSNSRIYERLALRDTIVLPKEGTLPDTDDALQLFYDTLHHSVAAIDGANTSGIIDAMIAGKPGIAILTEEYKKTQSDTKHFNQLVDAGALYLSQGAEGMPEIVAYLLEGKDELEVKRKAFIGRYIRPRGLDRAAGDIAADEIEILMQEVQKSVVT